MEFSEAIAKPVVHNVRLRRPRRGSLMGSLSVQGHHLIFSAATTQTPTHTPTSTTAPALPRTFIDGNEIWLMHKSVDVVSVEPRGEKGGGWLTLKCKNFLILVLEFPNLDDCQSVGKSVEILSNLADVSLEYPFYHRCPFTPLENGWRSFTTEQEFARLQMHTDFWRISHVNKDFKVCSSYPEMVTVPKKVPDDILISGGSFRDGGRFPVLSYYHIETRSALVRCSQPLVGQSNRRCREDEQILNSLLAGGSRGYIMDTRSPSTAQNAKNKGGGWEPDSHYPMWKRMHRAIPRWQSLQDSLVKLIEACNDSSLSSDRWISKLSGSGWLQVLAEVLTSACVAAQCLDREGEKAEVSVVVHGGDGMDSTLLVSSLTQVILDPDARTVRGFESLVEREWVSAGHPFRLRCAHAAYAKGKLTGPYESPTFLCFLDCVWQIYQQFSCSFEFNEDFLILLFENAYASEFGTFIGSSEKEKKDINAKENTLSLWSFINRAETLQQNLNPFYEPNNNPIWPSVAPQSLMLWERLYLRWLRDWGVQDAVLNTMSQWKTQEKDLISKVIRLRRQVVELEREATLKNSEENGVQEHA